MPVGRKIEPSCYLASKIERLSHLKRRVNGVYGANGTLAFSRFSSPLAASSSISVSRVLFDQRSEVTKAVELQTWS